MYKLLQDVAWGVTATENFDTFEHKSTLEYPRYWLQYVRTISHMSRPRSESCQTAGQTCYANRQKTKHTIHNHIHMHQDKRHAWRQHEHIHIYIYIYTRIIGRASRGLDSFCDVFPEMHYRADCLIANTHSPEFVQALLADMQCCTISFAGESLIQKMYPRGPPLGQHKEPGISIW